MVRCVALMSWFQHGSDTSESRTTAAAQLVGQERLLGGATRLPRSYRHHWSFRDCRPVPCLRRAEIVRSLQAGTGNCNAEARVARALSSPITDRYFATGSFNTSGPTGRAEFAMPVKGPKGNATILVAASKSLGKWNFEALVVEITTTHERIDLLRGPSSSTPASRTSLGA